TRRDRGRGPGPGVPRHPDLMTDSVAGFAPPITKEYEQVERGREALMFVVSWKRLAMGTAAATALVVLASGCSGREHPRQASPVAVSLPRIAPTDTPVQRAGKLARYIEARWPRIRVQRARADRAGTMVDFNDYPAYDGSIRDPA